MSSFFSRVIGKVAAEEGHEYHNERSIEAALATMENRRFDLVITAHILEDGRAETFMRRIEGSRHQATPVIVITADDNLGNRERFFTLGVMDYLKKSDVVPATLRRYFHVIGKGGEVLEELKGLKVAVLDDSKVSLHVIRSIFNFYDVNHVTYFASPKEMLDAGDFDLYIIDLVMPEMTGDEVLLTLRQRPRQGGIIVVSGVSNRLSMAHALTLGADDFIAKPFDAQDFIARVKGVVRNLLLMRELEEQSRRMEELSRRDSLTGLWNHGAIHDVLTHRLESDDRTVAIALLDLDNFKSVNDRFGHQVGDEVLLAVSDLLTGHAETDREVGRYGGEEFLVICASENAGDAAAKAEHLLEHIRKIDLGRDDLRITASCGVADSTEASDAMDLVELADQRLYQAKDAGKDQVAS